MSYRRVLIAVMLALAPMVLAQGDPDVLTVALSSAPETLDPHVASSRAVPLLENVYEPLAGLEGPTLDITPMLAESWDVSDDGTVYTFHLRSGVTFHDGTAFTADAVKTNFERVLSIQKGPYWALSYLDSIEAVDPLTVRMTIRPGGPPFIQAVSMVGIISPQAIAEHTVGDDQAQDWLALNTDGTGPYSVGQYVRGDRIILERFDDYWQGWDGPHFARAVMLFVPEMSSSALMIEQAEVDLAEQVPPESLPSLRSNPKVNVVESQDGVRVLYLMLNASAGPTADVRVRQALNYAFDTESFLAATGGAFVASDGPVPAALLGGYKPDIPYQTFDLDRAKGLLQEAGALGDTFDFYYTTGDQTQELAGQILQADPRLHRGEFQRHCRGTPGPPPRRGHVGPRQPLHRQPRLPHGQFPVHAAAHARCLRLYLVHVPLPRHRAGGDADVELLPEPRGGRVDHQGCAGARRERAPGGVERGHQAVA